MINNTNNYNNKKIMNNNSMHNYILIKYNWKKRQVKIYLYSNKNCKKNYFKRTAMIMKLMKYYPKKLG